MFPLCVPNSTPSPIINTQLLFAYSVPLFPNTHYYELHIFFPVVFPETCLTLENLSKVLDIISDRLWKTFGEYIYIPKSELKRIEKECKQ